MEFKKQRRNQKMKKEELEFLDLVLSPQVKLVNGYKGSVIYDFGRKKVYQVSKEAGVLLEKMFSDKERGRKENELGELKKHLEFLENFEK